MIDEQRCIELLEGQINDIEACIAGLKSGNQQIIRDGQDVTAQAISNAELDYVRTLATLLVFKSGKYKKESEQS